MAANPRGVSRKVLFNSVLLLLFLLAAIVLFFLLRENAPPLLGAGIDGSLAEWPASVLSATLIS
jgi:hypothetical protein